ncbi:MAG: cache domain-containing protein, partial [Bdellovibrionales bacterium]|nr:cache domain-containing protein [Bdellovibrionales bacterium]
MRKYFRINITNQISMAVGVVMLLFIVAGMYSVRVAEHALTNSIQTNAEAHLESISTDILEYLRVQSSMWRAYAQSDLAQSTLQGSNQEFAFLQNVSDIIDTRDLQWRKVQTGALNPLMRSLLDNELANDMRVRLEEFNREFGFPIFGEIFVTNRFGANVAQTHRTSDYRQDDEDWWQRAKTDGIFVSDVQFDESSKAFSTDLCIRIEDSTHEFLGVLKVVLNIEEIRSIIHRSSSALLQFARNKIVLLNSKQQIILDSQGDHAPLSDGQSILAGLWPLPQTGAKSSQRLNKELNISNYALGRSFEGTPRNYGLGWILVVEYDQAQIFAPIHHMERNSVLLGILTLLLAVILSFAFILHIRRRISRLHAAALDLAHG